MYQAVLYPCDLGILVVLVLVLLWKVNKRWTHELSREFLFLKIHLVSISLGMLLYQSVIHGWSWRWSSCFNILVSQKSSLGAHLMTGKINTLDRNLDLYFSSSTALRHLSTSNQSSVEGIINMVEIWSLRNYVCMYRNYVRMPLIGSRVIVYLLKGFLKDRKLSSGRSSVALYKESHFVTAFIWLKSSF